MCFVGGCTITFQAYHKPGDILGKLAGSEHKVETVVFALGSKRLSLASSCQLSEPIVNKIVSSKQTVLQGQTSQMDHNNLESFVNK